MSLVARIAMTISAAGGCAAADLAEETARWAPIADHGAPSVLDDGPGHFEGASQWWVTALVDAQPRLRLDGLRTVVRDQPGVPDGQIACGYQYDRMGGDLGIGGTLLRPYARFGSDPLAQRPDAVLGAIGFSAAAMPFFGFDGEVGESSRRGLIADLDAHFPLFHIGGSHDDRVDTTRLGFEIREPGSVNEFAWSLSLDSATTRRNDLPKGVPRHADTGFLGEATVAWSPWNHWLIAGQAALATNATRDDGWRGTVETAAIALGLGW